MYRLGLATRVVLTVLLAFCFSLVGLATPSARTATAATNQVFLPNITKTLGGPDGWTTPIVVQNIGLEDSDATISLYRFSDGALAATVRSPLLHARQSWTFDPRSNSALPNDTQFAAVVQATNGQVAATVIEGAGSSWMAYSGTTGGASTVYLPNVTRNLGGRDGWNTPFIVQNIGTKAATVSVSFYTFAGGALARRIDNVQLQPGRSQAFTPAVIDGLADDTQFAVVVQGPADAQLYAIVNEVSGGMAMSYEGLLGGSDVVYLPNVLKYLGGDDHWFTPFIVQNIGNAATTYSVEFYSFDTGRLVATIPASSLQPGRSAPVDVRFNPTSLPAGSYSVVVRGLKGSQLAAVVNEVDPGAGMAMSYLGIGQSQAQPSAYLPYVQKNAGGPRWFSPIVAQNVSASPADITLTLYDFNGAQAIQKVYPQVKPGAAAVYDPRFDRRLRNGTYSGIVQSTANISAVVNIAGNARGDYAMSFTSVAGPAVPVAQQAARTEQVGPYTLTLHEAANADIWIENTVDATTAAKIVTQADSDVVWIQKDFARDFFNMPVVRIFSTTESFTTGLQVLAKYSPPQAKQVADNTDALFSPNVQQVFVNWSELSTMQPPSGLRHELSHAMMSQIIRTNPTLPAWFDEGTAVLQELSLPNSKWLEMESRYGTASMAATGTLYPLDSLASPVTWETRTGTAGYYQYLEAAQAVNMLRADLGRDGVLQLLDLMGGGMPFPNAYATVAGKDFSEFTGSFAARAKALVTNPVGVVAVDDSPIGPGLSFFAYGFSPNTTVTIEVRSSTEGDVRQEPVSRYGTRFHYLLTDWPAGIYNITVSIPGGTYSVVANKR